MFTVILVDDTKLIVDTLARQIQKSSSEELKVVGIGYHGQDALTLLAAHRPDVVLMDLFMPIMDGIQATKRILQSYPATRIVIMTTPENDQPLLQCIEAGAIGAIMKHTGAAGMIHELIALLKKNQED